MASTAGRRSDGRDVGQTLATAGFAALWRGELVRPSELVPAAPDDADVVAGALARQGCAQLDADGRLVGIHGLTLRDTRHRILHDGVAHQTWCAFDAIGIPAALGLTATAHSDCPACGAPILVTIEEGIALAQGSVVLSLPDSSWANLLADFCAKADLYCTREHLDEHLDPSGTSGRVIDVATVAELGRSAWVDVAHLDLGDTP
jgi:Alkylmercury lyase